MHFKAPLATVLLQDCGCIDFKIREVHTAQMHLGVISMKHTPTSTMQPAGGGVAPIMDGCGGK